jgi:ribosomal protein S18 acetylase RimI-like enzyme
MLSISRETQAFGAKTCGKLSIDIPSVEEDILIREARPREAGRIETLVKRAYGEFRPLFPEKVWQAWMDNVRETVHSEAGVLLVAEAGGRVRGAVKFYPDASQAGLGQWPREAASMRILAVDPDSRGQGYGLLLVRECVRRAQALQIPTIYLYTGTFMEVARHIYEKLGFRRIREFDKDPGPIAYRLDL